MKTKKHDTRWLVSVALMAAIIIVLANTPLGMIQLPVIKATTVHIPVILGAILFRTICRSNSWRCIRYLFGCQQYNDTDSFILCIFTVYEYNRYSGSIQGIMGGGWMPDLTWCRSRMVVDLIQKGKGE